MTLGERRASWSTVSTDYAEGVQVYDRIGVGYSAARPQDPSIFAQVLDALGDAETVVNIGAGTGNYEPVDRPVLAIEPNSVMRSQRTSTAPTLAAFAEALPVADRSFDAALAMFTIHHWTDRDAGIVEMGRVSRRQIALVYEPEISAASFWLSEYFPTLRPAPPYPHPTAQWVGNFLNVREVRPLMVPGDCIDGFAGCYWKRPHRYLDADVQAGMSVLAKMDPDDRRLGSERLASALESGQWDERHGHLRSLDEIDAGYRLVVCEW